MSKFIRALVITATCLLMAGCYVIDVQQGNSIHPDKLAQLQVGMSKEQVRYIMGSPVLESAFNDDHWDYVYTLRDSHRHKSYQHVDVIFQRNKVKSINQA